MIHTATTLYTKAIHIIQSSHHLPHNITPPHYLKLPHIIQNSQGSLRPSDPSSAAPSRSASRSDCGIIFVRIFGRPLSTRLAPQAALIVRIVFSYIRSPPLAPARPTSRVDRKNYVQNVILTVRSACGASEGDRIYHILLCCCYKRKRKQKYQ